MTGLSRLRNVLNIAEPTWHVQPGPLMSEFMSSTSDETGSLLARVLRGAGREAMLELLDRSGVRGRAGGGFPTGHKWWLVSSAEAAEKYFVCNANMGEPGRGKESWFLLTDAVKVIEAVAIAAYCTDAHRAYIALPENTEHELAALETGLHQAHDLGMLGPSSMGSGYSLDIEIVKTPPSHLAGEETALLEFIEGRPLQPRKKPPVPTSAGLFGKPTAINNLETVLQCRYAIQVGVERYRAFGTGQAPGTMVFTLHGCVGRPGLYELPLGTTLRELISVHGNALSENTALKGIFPGGISSAVLDASALDTPLDFDSLRDAGSELGSGVIIVIGEDVCAVELASQLAEFFHTASCGKCKPCKDGTGRSQILISKIDQLEKPGLDVSQTMLPPSKRLPQSQLTIINNLAQGISYTDSVKGLDKILHLCEFYRYRGDCHHSVEAANTLISFVTTFRAEFEHHMKHGVCDILSRDSEMASSAAAVD
jgi:NADH-quinone oxidoreductase subunit F